MRCLRRVCVALVVVVATITALPPAAMAQEMTFEVRDADTLKTVLERQLNNRLTVALATGPELTGKVTKVLVRVRGR